MEYTTGKLSKAVAYAAKKHATQTRNEGTSYIYHPLAVAMMIKNMGFGLKYQIAAVLHDTLEDTDATEEELRSLFGNEVTDTVVLLTRHHGEDEEKYVDRILQNHIAAVVKNADKINNLYESAFIGIPGENRSTEARKFAIKYLNKTKKFYYNRFSQALNDSIYHVLWELSHEKISDRKESVCRCSAEEMTLFIDQKIDPSLQSEIPDFSLPDKKILFVEIDSCIEDPTVYCLYDGDFIRQTCSKCWKLTHHGWVLVPDDQINRKSVFYFGGNDVYGAESMTDYLRFLKNECHYFTPDAKIGVEL